MSVCVVRRHCGSRGRAQNLPQKCDPALCVFVSCLSCVSCATCFAYVSEIRPKNVTNCGASLSHVYHTYLNSYHI